MSLPRSKSVFHSCRRRRLLLTAVLLLPSATLIAQAPTKAYAPPRTAWGDPDLQGIFTNATVTPLERPAEFAEKEFLTDKEVAEWEAFAAKSHADEPQREGETGTFAITLEPQLASNHYCSFCGQRHFHGNRTTRQVTIQ